MLKVIEVTKSSYAEGSEVKKLSYAGGRRGSYGYACVSMNSVSKHTERGG